MIINGGSRRGAGNLAQHLLREDTNEHVQVIELHHASQNLGEALGDWQLMTHLTGHGKLGLYHANIDPDDKYNMTPDQWMRSVEVLEKELGLQGQPRAIIKHEKDGREHLHVVWQRTDIDTQKLRADNWNYAAHERAARQLEKEFGHDLVQGKHVGNEKDRAELRAEVDRTLSYAEFQQAQRAGKDAKQIKKLVTNLFHQSQNGAEFKRDLAWEDYILAKGNRRSLVLVDRAGEVYSLSRYTKGIGKDERMSKLGDLDQEKLFSVDQAKERQKQRWEYEQKHGLDKERAQEDRIRKREGKPLEILVDENQIAKSPELQKINEKYNRDMQSLIQYQKDERLYQEGIWADKINHKTKVYKQKLEERQKHEFWSDWGLKPEDIPKRKTDIERHQLGLYIKRRMKYWGRRKMVRESDNINDGMEKYFKLRQKRYAPKHSIMKAEARKKMRKYRNERDAEELIAHVDDLHRDRDDDRQNFEREQARDRLNLERRRQDDLAHALAQALKKEQENQERLQKAREEQQRQQSRDRDDPRDRDR